MVLLLFRKMLIAAALVAVAEVEFLNAMGIISMVGITIIWHCCLLHREDLHGNHLLLEVEEQVNLLLRIETTSVIRIIITA